MIIGVPGSGKIEIIIRFLLIAKKKRLKILLINYSSATIDNIIARILDYQKLFNEKDKIKFAKISSSHHIERKSIKPYTNSCNKFESIK